MRDKINQIVEQGLKQFYWGDDKKVVATRVTEEILNEHKNYFLAIISVMETLLDDLEASGDLNQKGKLKVQSKIKGLVNKQLNLFK